MRVLYHWTLDPASRAARIALGETKLKLKFELVNPWQPPENFIKNCIEGRPPALLDHTLNSSHFIVGERAIGEYAAEINKRQPLIPSKPFERAEMRRLCDWFSVRFNEEVIGMILGERLEKMMSGSGTPDLEILQIGRQALEFHLDYMEWLLSKRTWIIGADFTLADISAGAQISCLDYLDEMPWKKVPRVKEWYQMFKSRPSMRPILEDRLPGLLPPRHYSNPDF